MEISTLYWITRLESMKDLCVGIMTIGMIISIVVGFIMLFYYSEIKSGEGEEITTFNKLKRAIISLIILSILFGVAHTFIPTTKEVAFIYLTSKTTKWAENNEQVQKLPDNVLKMLNTKMEQYIEETLKDEVKGDK